MSPVRPGTLAMAHPGCWKVSDNNDERTIALGFAPGATVTVIANDPDRESMLVGVGSCRYILHRHLAKKVMLG